MKYLINLLVIFCLFFTFGLPSTSEAKPKGKSKKEASRSPASKKKKAKKDTKKKKRNPSSVKKNKKAKKKKRKADIHQEQSPEFAHQMAQEISTISMS